MKFILKSLVLFYSFLLIYACKEQVISEPPDEAAIKNSKIIVSSKPEDAQIYLNGKNMGIKTPDSLTWLPLGSCTITLKLGLFPDRSRDFTIHDSARISYFYDYYSDSRNYGGISCSTTPSAANVFVNDTLLAQKTPLTINNLFPGKYKLKVSLPNHRSDSSYVDVFGGVTQNLSFSLEDTTIWISYKMINSPVTSNHITTIYVDKYNRIWFGSRDGGLFTFYRNKWDIDNKSFTVSSILLDDHDNIWVATRGGLQFFDNLTGKWFDYGRYLPSTNVTCLFIDRYKNLWVGTTGGIAVYNGTTWSYITTDTDAGPLINNQVTCITMDNSNRMWIGTLGGINMILGRVWNYFTNKNMNLPDNLGNGIKDIQVGKEGMVWISHIERLDSNKYGGLSKFDGQSFSQVNINGFPTNHISKIWVDENNYKWISTINGVARFKEPGDLEVFTTGNSKLPASQVTDVRIDSNGDLWIATYGGGIAKLKKGNF